MTLAGAQLATEKTEDDAAQRTDVQSQSVHKVGESTVLQEEPSSSQVAEEDVGLDTLLSELKLEPGETQAAARQPLLDSFDLKGIAERIRSGKAKRILCMCGAGISVSAGIPDFRTPGTGLYSNLQKFDLPYPEAVFEINYFKRNPAPFFMLAKELFPGTFQPTPAHFFMKMLHDKGLLLRCFTQNIDSLENQAGLPKEDIVAAHGNFDSAHCVRCRKEHSLEHVRAAVSQGKTRCDCTSCEGLVKPDIVFFGESLPSRFFQQKAADFPQADLLIVMGTSLTVQPFASLIDKVKAGVPRVLINREKVGEADPEVAKARAHHGLGGHGFNFGDGNNRDVFYQGDCDAGVEELCSLLGWSDDLHQLIRQSHNPEHEAHNPMRHASM
ncbi:hypothetical protein ABBQ32_007510 [Trebouxia sp. C0010 RCD-2024]